MKKLIIILTILLLVSAFIGYKFVSKTPVFKKEIVHLQETPQVERKTIIVYFGNSNADAVVPEKRVIDLKEGVSLEQLVFEELQKGPSNKKLWPVIPEGTKFLSAKTEKGVCTLNLSREFIDNTHTGSAGEAMIINSIVNTFTEPSVFPGVQKVQFLIDGQVRDAFIHMAFDQPIPRNESIISRETAGQ